MSFPLLAHNNYPRISDVFNPEIDPGDTVISTSVYVSTDTSLMQRFSFNGVWEQGFFANGTNEKILVCREPDASVMFSDDMGDTWTQKASPVVHTSYHVAHLGYRQSDDTWFCCQVTDPGGARDGILWYSQDDADTWTRVDNTPYFDYRFNHFVVMGNGDVSATGYANAGGDNMAIELYTNTPAAETSITLLHADLVNIHMRSFQAFANGKTISDNNANFTITEANAASSANIVWTGAGYGWGGDPAGTCFIPMSIATDTLTFTFADAGTTTAEANDVSTFTTNLTIAGFSWSTDHGYMMMGGHTGAAMAFKLSTDVGVTWSDEYFVTLTASRSTTSDDKHIQLGYAGDGRWLIGYINSGTKRLRIDMFDIGSSSLSPNQYTGLTAAIMRQAPDIFVKMDDEAASTTVLDIGSKGYTNSVIGTPTFQQGALVVDGGKSVLIPAAVDVGVVFDSVIAPNTHAHVFVLQHDNTASVRILASSGDIIDPDNLSYYIFLAADHKVGIATYVSDAWVYDYSTTAITLDTTTLIAVRINENNDEGTFYIADALDAYATAISTKTLSSSAKLALAGAWDGASLDSSADGVTIDYYALIPNEYFDYGAINEAYGGAYVNPTVTDVASASNVALLLHADDSAMLGPFASERVVGGQYYTLINSVPGTVNRISSESTSGRLVSTLPKFGAGSAAITARSVTAADWKPWDVIYWPISNATPTQRGLPELTLGTRDFTYDLWVKPLVERPFVLNGSSWMVHSGGSWKLFGGLMVEVSPKATTAVITIRSYGPRSAPGQQFVMRFADIPGYTPAAWNHFAICRKDGAWYVFVGGNRGVYPSVTGSPDTAYLHEGGSWRMGVKLGGGSAQRRTQSNILIDEARLVLDEGLLTESFTPPTVAYDYS